MHADHARVDRAGGRAGKLARRLAQVRWIPGAAADIESDLSSIHHIHDPGALEAGRAFRLIYRLSFYEGAIRARLMAANRRAEQEQAQAEKQRVQQRSLAEAAVRQAPRRGSAWSFATAGDTSTTSDERR